MSQARQRLYFGHPVNTYGTPLEDEILRLISARFPEWETVNPNLPEHQAGYLAAKKSPSGDGMFYFTETVVPRCQAGVILPFRDGRWGAGLYREACVLWGLSLPVYVIGMRGDIHGPVTARYVTQPLTVEETRQRLQSPY